jgi:hypothetical protein
MTDNSEFPLIFKHLKASFYSIPVYMFPELKKHIRGSVMKRPGLLFAALLIVSLACSLFGSTTPAPLPPTASAMLTPVVELPSPTLAVSQGITPEASPTPSDPTIYGAIRIEGSSEFIAQTRAALALLEARSPDAYLKIQNFVGLIQQGQHSGMWAWETPPRYEVGDETAFYSVTWYASTIAHDATHSELYLQWLNAHPGESVPDDVWGGVEIERFCNGYQLQVLIKIGAPQNEIDYMSTLDGTHCDVDKDGDCDWDDYNQRDW